MADLYLNALPLSLLGATDTLVGRVWPRGDELDAALRADADRGVSFQHYSFFGDSYAWAIPGRVMPSVCQELGKAVELGRLPGSVVAFAARQAAVLHLVGHGFEARLGGIAHPARLSRRKINLAANAIKALPPGVGAYAALAVQGLPLAGDGREPGPVALIVDQWIEHVLDVPLADLARANIDLLGLRLRWHHSADCTCKALRVGDAGRMVGGDPAGTLTLRDPGGEHEQAPARCLTVHANASLITRYLASLNGRSERDISDTLHQATSKFAQTRQRWDNLERTARRFGELQLFEGVTASLASPLQVPRRSSLTEQQGPVALPPVPEGTLNFHYGAPQLAESAAQGLRRHGPYDEGQQRSDVLRAVVVAPEAFSSEAKKLRRILADGIERFEGLKDRYHLRAFESDILLFEQANRAGYENAVVDAAKSGVDIVFFVTKRDYRYARYGQNPYLAAKAALAASGIASQAVTVETLNQADTMLQWSTDSIGLAAYTKVGNIPYVLHDPTGGRELVLGIGRADVFDAADGGRHQRFGASVAVRQDGDFLFAGSTTTVNTDEDYEAHLSRLLRSNIARFSEEQGGEPDRVVLYVFKRTGKRELRAIERAIGNRNIGFALLHVNRDSPLWLIERNGTRIASPPRGTTVALGEHDRLLVTGDPKKPSGSHPLRLTLDSHSTYREIERLVQQAYGFTKTSYRGFLQSNEPSPILFGRLLAQKVGDLVPYGFSPATAAGPLGDRPWFL